MYTLNAISCEMTDAYYDCGSDVCDDGVYFYSANGFDVVESVFYSYFSKLSDVAASDAHFYSVMRNDAGEMNAFCVVILISATTYINHKSNTSQSAHTLLCFEEDLEGDRTSSSSLGLSDFLNIAETGRNTFGFSQEVMPLSVFQ